MILEEFINDKKNMIDDLREFVELETPSTDKTMLDIFADYFVNYAKRKLGIDATLIPSENNGNDIKLVINENVREQILLLCHYDTVFNAGTIKNHPFKIENGKGYGPGIFDMKAGIIQTVYALKYIIRENINSKRIVLLLTSDEEIGSEFSRSIIEEEAKKSSYALVMEPSMNGMLKTERNGVGTIKIIVHGKSSHAGLDPDKGINAIYELIDIIPIVKKMNSKEKGISLNLDIINGGTRSNVIPDYCEGIIDCRFKKQADAEKFVNELKAVKPINHGASIEIESHLRPPMVRTKKTEALFNKIKNIGKDIGIELNETSVAGGSDGNFCSYYCPVIDGLGAVGNGAHSEDEYILVDSMPERSALLYSIIKNISLYEP
ncbi:MAG: M20 family metallopeptidase [Candidatus Parvarchaeota archaeon]